VRIFFKNNKLHSNIYLYSFYRIECWFYN
jgi:hypothetical protein